MRFFATIDENRRVKSTMVTHDLSADYIAENNLIELSEQDYVSIDPLMVDHDIIIDENGILKAFQNIDHGISMSRQRINQYATTFIGEGFVYNGIRFKCTPFDQQNIVAKSGVGGKYKVADKTYVNLTPEQSTQLRNTMSDYISNIMEFVWMAKESLEDCTSFDELDLTVDTFKTRLDVFRQSYVENLKSEILPTSTPGTTENLTTVPTTTIIAM